MTLLIGYQIYTVINVKEELKEVRKAKDEIDDKMQKIADKLSKDFKEELCNAAPLIMAIASKDKGIIETESFKAYKNSLPDQLSKELARQNNNYIEWFCKYSRECKETEPKGTIREYKI